MHHEMQLVRRQRVVELIRQATASTLTIVQAPFGYGKTIAVEQFAATGDCRAVWVDAHHLVKGVLLGPDRIGSPGETTLVVIEDLQVVDDPAALERLAHLVETVPPHVRLLVTTRRRLDLPVARWRAQGLLAEIGLEELCFRPDEVAEAFPHDPLSPADRAELHDLAERSEGWAAGLRLLTDTPATGSVATPTGRALLDEVLADQPDDVREFLTTTSVLVRFSAGLCRVVTGSADAGRLLDRVRQANLFLLPLDEEQVWFRYQRLFAELLQARLRERGEAEVRSLHRRAAGWFLGQDKPDAVGHLVAAGDGEHALDLLAADVNFMSRSDGIGRGVDWSTAFPPGWIAETPTRMVYVAAVLTRTGWTEHAAEWMDRAGRALLHAPPDDPARALLAAARSIWHSFDDDPERTIEVGNEALARLGDANPPLRRRLVANMAIAHVQIDQLAEAEAYCAILDDTRSSELLRGLLVPALRARSAERQGSLVRAESLARQSLGTGEALGLPFHAAGNEARVALARVLIERGAFGDAEALLLATVDGYGERGWSTGVTVARVELARARAARNGPAAGLALIDDLRRNHGELPVPKSVRPALGVLEAQLRIEVGDLDGASPLIRGLRPGIDRQLLDVARALARRELRVAADLLDDVPVPDLRTRLVTDLRAARIAGLRGNHDVRDRRLLDAASAGAREGFCRVFVAEAPELLPTLRGLAETRRQLLPLVVSLDALQRHSSLGGGPDLALSRRELSVLRYLPSDLTNPEIATQLDITTNTLKTHVRSLYRKLGVGSRAAAVRAARASGLL